MCYLDMLYLNIKELRGDAGSCVPYWRVRTNPIFVRLGSHCTGDIYDRISHRL